SFETNITVLSSNSYKLVSKTCNKIVVLNKVSFSNKFAMKDFINDLRQYGKVELHENILKFIGIIKQNTYGIMFIHEYANEGTLRQYLDQNFCKLNWNDKLTLAKQLVSAIKCLHEKLSSDLNLLSAIIHGKRESAIPGTPKNYVNIYTECWKYQPNLRPTIQHIFKKIINIHYNYEEIITESKDKEYNLTSLLQHILDL
ncbi:3300_t:CDS:2, partial [Gigaspora margarita]